MGMEKECLAGRVGVWGWVGVTGVARRFGLGVKDNSDFSWDGVHWRRGDGGEIGAEDWQIRDWT